MESNQNSVTTPLFSAEMNDAIKGIIGLVQDHQAVFGATVNDSCLQKAFELLAGICKEGTPVLTWFKIEDLLPQYGEDVLLKLKGINKYYIGRLDDSFPVGCDAFLISKPGTTKHCLYASSFDSWSNFHGPK